MASLEFPSCATRPARGRKLQRFREGSSSFPEITTENRSDVKKPLNLFRNLNSIRNFEIRRYPTLKSGNQLNWKSCDFEMSYTLMAVSDPSVFRLHHFDCIQNYWKKNLLRFNISKYFFKVWSASNWTRPRQPRRSVTEYTAQAQIWRLAAASKWTRISKYQTKGNARNQLAIVYVVIWDLL